MSNVSIAWATHSFAWDYLRLDNRLTVVILIQSAVRQQTLAAWNDSCVTTAWRHQVGHGSACLQGTGAQKAQWERERERGCYVFIKSTRKQLRRLCSLDTPHLFIIIPLAVTLLFIIACWFICSSSLKPHLTSSFTLRESDVVRMYKDVAL